MAAWLYQYRLVIALAVIAGLVCGLWLVNRWCEADCGLPIVNRSSLVLSAFCFAMLSSVVAPSTRWAMFKGDLYGPWVVVAIVGVVFLIVAVRNWRSMGAVFGTISNLVFVVFSPLWVALAVLGGLTYIACAIAAGGLSAPHVQTRTVTQYVNRNSSW